MLTEAQTDSVIKCITAGKSAKFAFEDAPLCEVIDAIIDHLQSEQVEKSLFGLRTEDVVEMTPEDAEKAFVHHAMHWAFQLGVGATLFAVNQDLTEDE
jgi:phosphosulfolactate phosphohydrolase-like enzyme